MGVEGAWVGGLGDLLLAAGPASLCIYSILGIQTVGFLRARCCLPFLRWKWQRLARLPAACTKSLRALLRSADNVPRQQTNELLRSNG